jgi:protoporphyrinogen oxidase
MIIILGAGLSGLSCSYHLGHEKCILLEKNIHPFGQIGMEKRDGIIWDPGPHVSFTQNEYVKQLFATSVRNQFDEYEVKTGNYFNGSWIDHPAQTALHQIPEPLRTDCFQSFLITRKNDQDKVKPSNYMEWLDFAFGPVFAKNFPAAYTKKYWTCSPENLTTDWVGQRVLYPSIEDVTKGYNGPINKQMHYVKNIRYPKNGGYQSFANKLLLNANIKYGSEIIAIDLANKWVKTSNGETYYFSKLINTLPLPVFVNLCVDTPLTIREAALSLSCSQLLLVNVVAPHLSKRDESWLYIYDENKLSTRINFSDKLTKNNAPINTSGIQVEVYFSKYRPINMTPETVAEKVIDELIEMQLIDSKELEDGNIKHHTRYCPWANIIFDHNTKPALEMIWNYFSQYGLVRENDDCYPTTNWDDNSHSADLKNATLFMAGRYGQWKYYWTDDCVLRGRDLANRI